MIRSAADSLAMIADKAVKERGRFILSLSGGNTPRKLYKLLSGKDYLDRIPWKHCYIFWGDERCVPYDDERNNARMATELLLSKTGLTHSNIFPVPVNLHPPEAALQYEESIRSFFGNEAPRFDLILLGIGTDGHTASLFPGTGVLHEEIRWVKEVFADSQQMFRITMIPSLINQARNIFFLAAGEEKSHILREVLATPATHSRYPVQLIAPRDGEVTWYLEVKAASLLPPGFRSDH